MHCVIIGFSVDELNDRKKYIFTSDSRVEAKNISPYLIDGEIILPESRNSPLCNVLPMATGNRPADGGNLIIEEEDYEEFIKREPRAIKYIKELTGAEEYIKNKKRCAKNTTE